MTFRRYRVAAAMFATAIAGLAFVSSPARAFRSRDTFGKNANEGGGGQRYFTGSPVDESGCNVCHAEKGDAELKVSGAPEVYQLGQTYEITVTWAASGSLLDAGSIELMDKKNGGTGVTALLPAAQLGADEVCSMAAGTAAAGPVLTLVSGRQVAGTNACEATKLRIRWSAPPADAGPVWIYAQAVKSDGDGTNKGDVAAGFRAVISSPGESANLATVKSCSASEGIGAASVLWWFSLLCWWQQRRWRHRSRASDEAPLHR